MHALNKVNSFPCGINVGFEISHIMCHCYNSGHYPILLSSRKDCSHQLKVDQ